MGGSTGVDTGQLMVHKEATTMVGLGGGNALGNGHFENWGDSGLADNSQQTDTSTDVDTDDKNQVPSPVFFFTLLFMFFVMSFSCKPNIELFSDSYMLHVYSGFCIRYIHKFRVYSEYLGIIH